MALLRYAVHTLSFPEASPLQKQSALAAACSLADQVTRTVEAELTLRVDWIESELIGAGQLGITLCPGRRTEAATSARIWPSFGPRGPPASFAC